MISVGLDSGVNSGKSDGEDERKIGESLAPLLLVHVPVVGEVGENVGEYLCEELYSSSKPPFDISLELVE